MMFLLCRTEPDKPKHQGLSYLLVPMTAPGIEVRPLVTMTGRATFNETFFTDVRVPIDQIVMGRGDGWHVANVTLKYERLLLGDANRLSSRLERIRRAYGAHDLGWPAHHGHSRVPGPAAAPAGRGDGLQVSRAAAADRASARRGLRAQAPDRQIQRHDARIPPILPCGRCAGRRWPRLRRQGRGRGDR